MTRRDVLRCLNEPFADPCFFGPEARSERNRRDGKDVVADGYDSCSFASRVSLVERENVAEEVWRIWSTAQCFLSLPRPMEKLLLSSLNRSFASKLLLS